MTEKDEIKTIPNEEEKQYLMRFDSPAKNAIAMMLVQMMPLHLAFGVESAGIFFVLGKKIDMVMDVVIDQDKEGIFIVVKSSTDL